MTWDIFHLTFHYLGLSFSGMNNLPEDCISRILSFISPKETCKLSLISKTFRSAVESNVVWEKFLPFDYRDIVSCLVMVTPFCSKKELFLQLCNPVYIDDGRKIFKLEKSTGEISYMLSAKELSITYSNDPIHCTWKSMHESRFKDVVEFKGVDKIEIQGKIRANNLSPRTRYGAYLIVKVSKNAYGLDSIPSEISVQVGTRQVSSNTAYLQGQDKRKQFTESLFYANRIQMLKNMVIQEGEGRIPNEREDGWMEIEIGEFFNGDNKNEEIKMSLKEVKGYQLKGGLIVEGIELRPKEQRVIH